MILAAYPWKKLLAGTPQYRKIVRKLLPHGGRRVKFRQLSLLAYQNLLLVRATAVIANGAVERYALVDGDHRFLAIFDNIRDLHGANVQESPDIDAESNPEALRQYLRLFAQTQKYEPGAVLIESPDDIDWSQIDISELEVLPDRMIEPIRWNEKD